MKQLTVESFEWQVPAEFNYARDVIDALGEEDAGRSGLCSWTARSDDGFTFGEISAASQPLRRGL